MLLATQFAEWFGTLTGKWIGGTEESFCKSLEDGVVLCRVVQSIMGSDDQLKIHDPVKNSFEGRENIVTFQESCRRRVICSAASQSPSVARFDDDGSDSLRTMVASQARAPDRVRD